MKIKCEKCGFEEIPENFNGLMKIQYDTTDLEQNLMRMIVIECPVCQNQAFFQHFKIDRRVALSFSHLLAVSKDEAKTSEEANQVFLKKLANLKQKYNTP